MVTLKTPSLGSMATEKEEATINVSKGRQIVSQWKNDSGPRTKDVAKQRWWLKEQEPGESRFKPGSNLGNLRESLRR